MNCTIKNGQETWTPKTGCLDAQGDDVIAIFETPSGFAPGFYDLSIGVRDGKGGSSTSANIIIAKE